MKQMDSIRVSIITVSFNAEQTIEQTIKSVLNQSYENIEYIIVDGASTDSTCRIISKYQSRIDTFISENDKGVYDAMNKGIGFAKGDIIGILNSDDIYVGDAVSKIVQCYQKSNADVIYGNAVWFDQKEELGLYRCGCIEDLWYRMAIPHPAVFVKSTAYEKYGGFDTGYSIAADYDLMLRFYCNRLKFEHVDETITYFRFGGKSYQNQRFCIEDAKEVALRYINRCNRKEYYLKKIYNRYYECYLTYLWENDRQTMEKETGMILNTHLVEKIVIFGTGKWGQRFGSIMQNLNVKIDCFVDNDKLKQQRSVCGIATESPNILKDYSGGVLIAVSQQGDKIMEQIRKINNSLFALTLSDIGKYVFDKSGWD